MGQIRVTSKKCTVGVPPGTGLGNTDIFESWHVTVKFDASHVKGNLV